MKRKHQMSVLEDDLDTLLHPSQIYEHPSEVVRDTGLSLNEKRAVLASWASDACAIEAAPALRKCAGGQIVEFDEIMDALRALDRQNQEALARHRKQPRAANRSTKLGRGAGGHGDQGAPLQ